MNEESLFQDAKARPSAERATFLDTACAGQPELRAAVETLLASNEAPGGFVILPPADPEATVDSEEGQLSDAVTRDLGPQPGPPSTRTGAAGHHLSAEAGLTISGRCTLEAQIGEGGMGEVWVAKQTEPVKRKVALKLIKTGHGFPGRARSDSSRNGRRWR